MKNIRNASCLIALQVLMLAGCNFSGFSTESKINSAFPVSRAVELAKVDVIEKVASDRAKLINQEYSNKLKLRALSCAKGYAPSWYTTESEIKKNLPNHSCFVAADAELARWLGLIRVGIYLAQPPLAPVPAKAPKYIANDDFVQSARFADAAGIVLIEGQRNIQIVEVASGKQILKEPKTHSQLGQLSPNGRLFTSGGDNRVRIRSVETGEVIVEIALARSNELHWLDHASAIFNHAENNKAVFLDFENGTEFPLPGIQGPVMRVAHVPGTDDQFVLGTYQTLSKIEVMRTGQGTEVNLIDETSVIGSPGAVGISGLTADGTTYFSASKELTLTAIDSLEQEIIPFQPFYIQAAIATPKPGAILLSAAVPGSRNWNKRHYLYSVDSHTVTPLDGGKIHAERFVYVSSLKKLAVFANSKIELLDDLGEGEPIAVSKFLNDALMEENLRKLEAFEQQQRFIQDQTKSRQSVSTLSPSITIAPPAARMPTPASPYVVTGQMAGLARDAQIEAIGVYESADRVGSIRINVRPSAKPIILVLSSYEALRWIVIQEPGARLNAILLSGYKQSQVIGASSVRTIEIGSNHAYKSGSAEYMALDNDVFRYTGKRIGLFQGRYSGTTFNAGGQ